jgi:tripartite-type tricarboxylate transporter receptor subunit TctC
MPGMSEAMTAQGFESSGEGPEAFGALIKSEVARYARIVKIAGIRAE